MRESWKQCSSLITSTNRNSIQQDDGVHSARSTWGFPAELQLKRLTNEAARQRPRKARPSATNCRCHRRRRRIYLACSFEPGKLRIQIFQSAQKQAAVAWVLIVLEVARYTYAG